jgi:YidC/Oxa1 family membrane protein insertase
MHAILKAIFYTPLYNGLIFFLAILPYHNVGLAIILFTLFIKIILFPFTQKSVRTQFEMKRLEPELAELRAKYKDNKQMQAEKLMEFYKERGINPLSGIFLTFIQLVVLIVLYYIILHGGLPNLDHTTLYPFTATPNAGSVDMNFLGINVSDKSNLLALIAAITQFFQIQLTMPKIQKRDPKNASFGDDLSRSMGFQMRFIMPVVIFLTARSFAATAALYLITSSLFAVGQELYMRKKFGLIRGVQSAIK